MSLNRVAEPGKLYHMTFGEWCVTVFFDYAKKVFIVRF
ncbi:MAG: hypothetical protein QG607_479 [Patescibacteria group bacterium]|jgi:hypothetical protein|nr:hypothetical protein [Patescibacteria group bacterium]